ncbi:DUF2254 domain-containing protein, partial [Shigella boydii]|nr:DUF2254 domain-containing protein [Shigella boydii]
MREIQIRVLKGLSMLSKGWPEIFAEAAHTLAFETLEHATRADHIDSDRYLIKSTYYNLFSGEYSNKKNSCRASNSVVGKSRAKHSRENGRMLCAKSKRC